ncbi:MAG TPA: SIMPL domain-containing protein [Streptosporangiaceae bacterium]|nr:SIMPL domain-containing protein [Streptosporangiaceae bacterium]
MNGQPVISVRGEASLEVEPEIAIVSVIVQARDRDREKVLRRLADRNHQVSGLIKGYGEAVEKLESGSAHVRPELKDKRAGERVAGYLAQAGLRVTIRDFTVLGGLIVSLADAELVTVEGPWWALRPDSPVYRDARLAAGRDATARAGEYAEAFGGRLGDLLEAADTGLLTANARPDTWRFSGASAAAGRRSARAESAQPELDLEPERQTVSAQVEARFAMTRPASGQAGA